MENNPLVSILIPNYNKDQYLRETLDSVLTQTYTNWECIIVDDHSTDNSWEILEEYQKKDSRFKIFKRPEHLPKGGNFCRNYALELSHGDLIQWLDSDDLIHKRKIEVQVIKLSGSETSKKVSIANWKYLSKKSFNFKNYSFEWEGYPSDNVEILIKLWNEGKFFPIFTFLISRDLALFSGIWNEKILKNQDGEYTTRIVLNAELICFSKDAVGFYRKPKKSHVSTQNSYEVLDSFLTSVELSGKYLRDKCDNEFVRSAILKNYEKLFVKFYTLYPSLSKKTYSKIKKLILANRYNFNCNTKLLKMSLIFGFYPVYYLKKISNKISLLK